MRWRHTVIFALLALLAAVATPTVDAGPPVADSWRQAGPGYTWHFPRDMYAHPGYKTEWWYITGNLVTDDAAAAEIGFQFTIFRIGVQPAPLDSSGSAWQTPDLIMGHAAVTDPTGGGHVFSEVLWRTTPFLGGFGAPGDSTLAWCVAPPGTPGRWQIDYQDGQLHLQARDDHSGLAYDLHCRPTRAPVLHGTEGYSPKSASGDVGSLYFSQPRMQVTGTVRREGKDVPVTGESWLDREIFSNTLGAGQKGWDWVALQLDDGREVMLYRLLDAAGQPDFALGTLVAPDGTTTPLPAGSWTLTARKEWRSPQSGARYPVQWDLAIPGADLDLRLEAVMPDQENLSVRTGIHYWEGAVRARPQSDAGPRSDAGPGGRGFVEMTGYGEGSRPPI